MLTMNQPGDTTSAPSSVCSILASGAATARSLAGGAAAKPRPRTVKAGYLNLNSAVWSVPSTSSTCSWRQVPPQPFEVFQA